jgi:hypothetical protein
VKPEETAMHRSCAVLLLLAAPAAAETFDLTIEGKRYDIRVGEPLTVPGVGTLRLERREAQTYKGNGVQFDYPSAWKLTEEKDEEGAPTLTVEPTGNAFIMLSRIDAAMASEKDLVKAQKDAMLGTFKERGAKVLSDGPSSVLLLGKERNGARIRTDIAGEKATMDLVAVMGAKGGWVVMFHTGDDEKNEAEKAFKRFRDTFSLSK